MKISEIKSNLPEQPGCYLFSDTTGKIIYVGKAANLKNRVSSYWHKSNGHTPAKTAMVKQTEDVSWIEMESEIEALLLESNLIKKHQPYFNVLLRDDKRFLYLKVSTEDEIPGIFATRTIDKSGRYFGPFTGAMPVRETLKAIRKIWPYCTERKVKVKPCFYAQIGRCFGPCGGDVDIKEYKEKVIKPIIMFFEGKKGKILKDYEARIKSLEKEGGEDSLEEARKLKYQLMNIRNVLEHTKVISISEKYKADVVELAKILSLPQIPLRIEGYDISNIFGREAVGSMVVFTDGEPDKNEYRKFKIKIGQGEANDVGMMKEVVERRIGRSITNNQETITKQSHINYSDKKDSKGGEVYCLKKNEQWPMPDLIILDGGKGQLGAVSRLLKRSGFDIPVIAVSKGNGLRSAAVPDKIFFPGEKNPLRLPAASPALHIIKRVRDEAHRFAIKYHRDLRQKKMFGK